MTRARRRTPRTSRAPTIAIDLINHKLGGIKGHPLALDECSVNTDAQASTCATQMVGDGVKVVLTGTIALNDDNPMYTTLFAAHIPVIEGNRSPRTTSRRRRAASR